MSRVAPYLLVGIGGFAGANARLMLARLIAVSVDTRFPLGTFVINTSGSFLLGLITVLVAERFLPYPEEVRLAAGIGFLGAFTTFSTFEFETNVLLDSGAWAQAALNVIGSAVAGLIAVRVGVAIARGWVA
ncbi:MAG: fluoride efflux transporter CrcB [Vicinamibacterales bacterium]